LTKRADNAGWGEANVGAGNPPEVRRDRTINATTAKMTASPIKMT
jgi:hypothetical protein